ncbi:MAG: D-alanyl-D-alanine carboxypeptidase [Acidobacteriota bacterium]|nr:D-alanyl-D-alanine carboxypeptidase [Acidobacteriota bacterium]
MFGSLKTKAFWLFITLIALTGAGNLATVSAQTPQPYLPKIEVQPSSTPLVKKTGGSTPIAPNPDIPNTLDTFADITVPGYTGILVEDEKGRIVKESYSDYTFNPASNVKVATSYAVLKTFGPEYRFPTNVYYDGVIDKNTATLNGNLYVSGRDPVFTLEHGVAIADAMNRLGVRNVTGDLIVTDRFVMSFSESAQRSGQALLASLDAGKRSAAATRAWLNFLTASGKPQHLPSVSVAGALYVDIIPNTAKLLFSHESAPLREIVKVTNCYSNNFLSERLGDMLGGAYAVARVVQLNANVAPQEFSLQTSSGLGINRVTPKAMMKLLKALKTELARYRMTFADIMPIAGVDPGTLQNRFKNGFSLGSLVGKTGTLGNTDGGVSALCGEINTRNGGKMLFVIFNQRGTVGRFRGFQDSYITMLQNEYGGAAPLGYTTAALALRMSKTRITYAASESASN